MKKPRTFITDSFLARVREEGSLAMAAKRVGEAYENYQRLERLSTWALVCEEIVDTEYEKNYYDQVVAELGRRGIRGKELTDLRMFAWQTAGWLNFEKMLWDWCSLDEKDILSALDWLSKDGEITKAEHVGGRFKTSQ